MKALGLIPGLPNKMESTTYVAGTVCFQSPNAGERVLPGTIVNYTVSTGATMPTDAPDPTEPPEPTPDPNQPQGGDIFDPSLIPPPVRTPRRFEIPLWEGIAEDIMSVYVKVEMVSGDTTQVIEERFYNLSSFPVPIEADGTGPVEFIISTLSPFNEKIIVYTFPYDFGE
jgi:hypothetical protein